MAASFVRSVSILGCGWLGLQLGAHLVERGYAVHGSTTTPEKLVDLRAAGIAPHCIVLGPALQSDAADAFFETDALVLNVPPPRGRDDVVAYHRRQIESVLERLRKASVRYVLFASSTGVYPGLRRVVDERDARPGQTPEAPLRPTGRALLEAEGLLMRAGHFDATVVRLGGLYGYGRHPARYLAGRTGVEEGGRPVNLIHRDDCIGIIEAVIEQAAWGEVFNACADAHPTRRALYTQAARRLGLEPPVFANDEKGAYKIVSNQKLKERLGYRFRHPDPLDAAP